MDLALALVEDDLGHAASLAVARELVLFLRRPGSQAQFSTLLQAQSAQSPELRELQGWMAEHLARDLSVPVLAERVAMSPRNFARVFARQVGETPARYVERLRVEAVRRMLEEDGRRLEGIAHATGFAQCRRHAAGFPAACAQTTPERYRAAFRSQGDGSEALSEAGQDAPTPD
ncbi:helix-turn-helix domain-containing protein [Cupriavidus basilensis]